MNNSGHQSSSNPNIIFGCAVAALMARIEHAPRLDQQQLNFMLGKGLCSTPFGTTNISPAEI
jgi:hypothetical protein